MLISRDGWCSLPPAPGLEGLHVRVKRDASGRLTITDLYVHGAEITADVMRGVSISRLEASLNDPAVHAREGAALDTQEQKAGDREPDDGLTLPDLRARAPHARERRQQRPAKLGRPTGQDPEAFYRQVALSYSELARSTRAPAKALADDADVPVTTVHRWIREARRRGFLPPGRKGKAG